MITNVPTVKENHFENLQNILKQSENRPLSNEEIKEVLQQSLDLLRTMQPTPENNLLKKTLFRTVDELYRLEIVNTVDFFKDYFENLPEYKTPEECFNNLNDYYFKFFGEYRYRNFEAFREALGMSFKNAN